MPTTLSYSAAAAAAPAAATTTTTTATGYVVVLQPQSATAMATQRQAESLNIQQTSQARAPGSGTWHVVVGQNTHHDLVLKSQNSTPQHSSSAHRCGRQSHTSKPPLPWHHAHARPPSDLQPPLRPTLPYNPTQHGARRHPRVSYSTARKYSYRPKKRPTKGA